MATPADDAAMEAETAAAADGEPSASSLPAESEAAATFRATPASTGLGDEEEGDWDQEADGDEDEEDDADAWWAKLRELKAALAGCAEGTKAFLAPLLGHPAAQQVLVSFLNDASRSFEDWVHEPRSHAALGRLRERLLAERRLQRQQQEMQQQQRQQQRQECEKKEEEGDAGATAAAARYFERLTLETEAKRRAAALAESDALSQAALEEAEAAKAEAKRLFEGQDFAGAIKAYEHAASVVVGWTLKGEERMAHARSLVAACLTNAAVCTWKAGSEDHDVRRLAKQALAADPSYAKALYWRARSYARQGFSDAALADAERALELARAQQPNQAPASSSSASLDATGGTATTGSASFPALTVATASSSPLATAAASTAATASASSSSSSSSPPATAAAAASTAAVPTAVTVTPAAAALHEMESLRDTLAARVASEAAARARDTERVKARIAAREARGETVYSSDEFSEDEEAALEMEKETANPYIVPPVLPMTNAQVTPVQYLQYFLRRLKRRGRLEEWDTEVEGAGPNRVRFQWRMLHGPLRIDVRATDSSRRKARQRCALLFIKEAHALRRRQLPARTDIPDLPEGWEAAAKRLDEGKTEKRKKAALSSSSSAEVEGEEAETRPWQPQEFMDWADGWLALVVEGTVPALYFPASLSSDERRAIHARCTPKGLKSDSIGKGDSRRVHVFVKDAQTRADRGHGYVEVPSDRPEASLDLASSLPVRLPAKVLAREAMLAKLRQEQTQQTQTQTPVQATQSTQSPPPQQQEVGSQAAAVEGEEEDEAEEENEEEEEAMARLLAAGAATEESTAMIEIPPEVIAAAGEVGDVVARIEAEAEAEAVAAAAAAAKAKAKQEEEERERARLLAAAAAARAEEKEETEAEASAAAPPPSAAAARGRGRGRGRGFRGRGRGRGGRGVGGESGGGGISDGFVAWTDAWLDALQGGKLSATATALPREGGGGGGGGAVASVASASVSVHFPASLSGLQRRHVHHACLPRGLASASVGEGETRRITVHTGGGKTEETGDSIATTTTHLQIPDLATLPTAEALAALPVVPNEEQAGGQA